MHHIVGFLVAGAVLGGISAAGDKRKVRPVLRGVVKGGIVAKRKIDTYRAAAVAETQKLVHEASAELDRQRTEHEA
jgi:hypothetical protein